MKNVFLGLVLCVIVIGGLFSLAFHSMRWGWRHNTEISISESDNYYQLHAYFNRNKTKRLQRFMDAQLHQRHTFVNSRIDGSITLDDKTNFYIKTSPGVLFIKLNKGTNDFDSYYRVKQMGEGIKRTLAND
jgi:hypothetical protein